MISSCCSPPPPDIKSLRPEERQEFGKLVHDLRKQGRDLESAQRTAYSIVLFQSIPYEREQIREHASSSPHTDIVLSGCLSAYSLFLSVTRNA